MTRASGRTWQSWVVGVGMMTLVLLGGWCWRATSLTQDRKRAEASPYAGMVEIPGGSFTMGRDDGLTREQPAHQVFLPTFYIDRNLVTVVEFTTFVQAKGPTGPHGEMYLDVHDPDNRIQQRDGVWMPDRGFELHRWAKSAGSGRWHTANGGRSVCPVKRNGRKRHAARMAASIPGAMTRRGQTSPSLAASVARQCPSGCIQRGRARMACWTWRDKCGSGRPLSTKPYPYEAQDGRGSHRGRVARRPRQ